MKVVRISYHDRGGAANGVIRIHKGLLDIGVDSKMLLIWNNRPIPQTYSVRSFSDSFLNKLRYRKIDKKQRQLEQQLLDDPTALTLLKQSHLESFYRLERHPLVRQADLIHLHWIKKTIHFPTFFKVVRKPIVWTFHDMSPFTGGNPYTKGLDRESEEAYHQLFTLKKKLLSETAITGVATSKVYQELALKSGLFKEVRLIPHGLDTSIFKLQDQQSARQQLGLPPDKKIVLFVAVDLNSSRKGLTYLLEGMENLKKADIQVVAVGNPVESAKMESVLQLGYIADPVHLAKVYAAADLFVSPAVEEAFGHTTLEALACGTPAVTFSTAGGLQLIKDRANGLICSRQNTTALLQTIHQALEHPFDRSEISQQTAAQHHLHKVAKAYRDLYQEILDRRS